MNEITNAELSSRAKFGRKKDWEIVNSGLSTPLGEAAAVASEARHLAAHFGELLEGIQADENLSDVGKARKVQLEAAAAMASLETLRAKTGTLETAKADAVKAVEKKGDSDLLRVMSILRQTEIRQLLLNQFGADPLQVHAAVSDALAVGDLAVVDAVISSPSIWPGRPSQEILDGFAEARLGLVDPEGSQELAELTEASQDADKLLNLVAEDIRETAGLKPPDALKAIIDG